MQATVATFDEPARTRARCCSTTASSSAFDADAFDASGSIGLLRLGQRVRIRAPDARSRHSADDPDSGPERRATRPASRTATTVAGPGARAPRGRQMPAELAFLATQRLAREPSRGAFLAGAFLAAGDLPSPIGAFLAGAFFAGASSWRGRLLGRSLLGRRLLARAPSWPEPPWRGLLGGGRRPWSAARRRRRRLRQLLGAADNGLELCTGLELRDRRLLDLHGGTGLRVAGGPRRTVDLLEDAEASDDDPLAGRHLALDHVDHGVERPAAPDGVAVEPVRESLDQLALFTASPCCKVVGRTDCPASSATLGNHMAGHNDQSA